MAFLTRTSPSISPSLPITNESVALTCPLTLPSTRKVPCTLIVPSTTDPFPRKVFRSPDSRSSIFFPSIVTSHAEKLMVTSAFLFGIGAQRQENLAGIDGRTVLPNFEVQVRPRAEARVSQQRDWLAFFYECFVMGKQTIIMPIVGKNILAVVNDHQIAPDI